MRLETTRLNTAPTAITIDALKLDPPLTVEPDTRTVPPELEIPKLELKKAPILPPLDVEIRTNDRSTTSRIEDVTSTSSRLPGDLGKYAPGFKKLTTSIGKELGLDDPSNLPRFKKLLDSEVASLRDPTALSLKKPQQPVLLNEILPDKKLLGDLTLKLKRDGFVSFVDIGNIDTSKLPKRSGSFGTEELGELGPRTRLLEDTKKMPLLDQSLFRSHESLRDRMLREKTEEKKTPGFWSKLGAFALGSAVNFVADYFLFNTFKYDDPSKHDGKPCPTGYRVFQYSLQAYTSGWLAKNYGTSTATAMMWSQWNAVNDFGYYGVGHLLDKAGLIGRRSRWDRGVGESFFDDTKPPDWFTWTPLALDGTNLGKPNPTYGSQLVVQAVNSVPITIGMLRLKDKPLKDTKLADSPWGFWMKGIPTWQPF